MLTFCGGTFGATAAYLVSVHRHLISFAAIRAWAIPSLQVIVLGPEIFLPLGFLFFAIPGEQLNEAQNMGIMAQSTRQLCGNGLERCSPQVT